MRAAPRIPAQLRPHKRAHKPADLTLRWPWRAGAHRPTHAPATRTALTLSQLGAVRVRGCAAQLLQPSDSATTAASCPQQLALLATRCCLLERRRCGAAWPWSPGAMRSRAPLAPAPPATPWLLASAPPRAHLSAARRDGRNAARLCLCAAPSPPAACRREQAHRCHRGSKEKQAKARPVDRRRRHRQHRVRGRM